MSAMKPNLSRSQGMLAPGQDHGHMRTVETAAATIRFAAGSVSDSGESDIDDVSFTDREGYARTTSHLAQRLVTNSDCTEKEGNDVSVNWVRDHSSTKRGQPVQHECSSSQGKQNKDEGIMNRNKTPSHQCNFLSSDGRIVTETVRTVQGNVALAGHTSPVDQVNRQSLRFNPFNTLCQDDDQTKHDFSHRRIISQSEGTSPKGQTRPQVVRTDSKAGACRPVPTGETAGEPIMVTTGVKRQSPACTVSSDSWTDPFETTPQESGIDYINSNTELYLSEEHFSQPEDHLRMSSREDLEAAITNCKQLIVEVEPNSEDAKNLIHKLVQLRLRLADSMEEEEKKAEDEVKRVVGHQFEEKQSRSSKHYCEKCNCVIWGMLQRWYRCTECGFCTHAKCLGLITRKCAAVKVYDNPTYLISVCGERGLSSQNYRCAECKTKIGFQRGLPEARQCDYNGNYYCDMCHWNDTAVIPARVLHNWDFEPRKVCRASKQFLKLMFPRPVLHIQQINPMLFSYVEELNDTKRLREEIIIMKQYFLSCKAALDSKLLLQLRPRQHFVETSDMYSLKDLVDVATDVLLPELAKIHASIAQHIKTDCQVCQLKGYICELCDLREVLFPFDSIAIVCPLCSAVLHRHCYMQSGRHCPKCERINRSVS